MGEHSCGVNWLNSNLILHAIATGEPRADLLNVVNELGQIVPIGNGIAHR